MAKRLKVDELLRLACIYAEQDREEYLRCQPTNDPHYQDIIAETKAFLKQLHAYRMKRWGPSVFEQMMADCRTMTAEEFCKFAAGERECQAESQPGP